MDLRILEYFVRVAEIGSINRAAESLQVSQPALSRHIATLEHEMGNRLFARSRSGVSLTEAGRLLADRVRPLLSQLAMLKQQVGETASGQLAIGVPPAWQSRVTAPFVSGMRAQYPTIALRVYEALSHMVRDYMAARLLDLAIVPVEFAPVAGYRTTPVLREPMVLTAAADKGLNPAQPIGLAQLSEWPLVVPGPGNAARNQLEHALARRRLPMRVAAEADTLGLCLELAQRGVGSAVVPASSIGQPVSASMSWAPVRGLVVTWALCENQDRLHSAAMQEGRRLLRATLAQAARRDWPGAQRLPVG